MSRAEVAPTDSTPFEPEPLWRDMLGARFRQLRQERELTLADTAARAGISTQYLSEVERGLKEPSSEIISAIAGALGTSLLEITSLVSLDLTPTAAQVLRPLRVATSPSRWSGPVALAA